MKKTIKLTLISLLMLLTITAGIGLYFFNQPHRNVQASKTDFSFNASQLVHEYLIDPKAANQKYLEEEGDSKILEVTGIVNNIEEDYNGLPVVLLKSDKDKAGVSCTMISKTPLTIKKGDNITIKGVIRSGAAYDKDMDLYENVIMENCKIIQ